MISRRALAHFAAVHADAGGPLDAWYRIAKGADWSNLIEVQATWPSAESVGDLTVFNIKGNTYRLIAQVYYEHQTLLVRAIITHAEYDRGDWK